MRRLAILLCIMALLGTGCSKGDTGQQNEQAVSNLPASSQQEQQLPEQQPENKEPQLPGAVIVMIDNHNKARPQSGLDKADLVYEILAEGGITRYMAFYYTQAAEKIGPVRSARYYFVQLAKGYNYPYAHAGGNVDALELIQKLKLKDMDEIYNAGAYFWRDKQRKAPHNLYTSTEKLIAGAQKKGYTLSPLEGLPLGESWTGSSHGDIRLDYSTGKSTYIASWHYNGQEYERKINGKPHVMDDGTAIKAQNILVLAAATREVMKEEIQSEIDILDKGQLIYFIEGKVAKGSWEKKSAESPIVFKDEQGKPLKIKDGQTWVQVLPSLDKLTY